MKGFNPNRFLRIRLRLLKTQWVKNQKFKGQRPKNQWPRTHCVKTQGAKTQGSKTPWIKTPCVKAHCIRGIFGFVLVLGFMASLSHYMAFVYSPTDSSPYHVFLQLKTVPPSRGQYTQFYSPWYGKNVIKKVIGQEGDDVFHDPSGAVGVKVLDIHSLWFGRQFLIGKPRKRAKDGRVLTPIKPGTIPRGMVFVSGDHDRSFDSRYEEMGLVPVQDLKGRLVALI